MIGCCGINTSQNYCDDFLYDVKEESDGITVSIKPKDPGKSEALKNYVKSSRELFGRCC